MSQDAQPDDYWYASPALPTAQQQCASIRPYLKQLVALSISKQWSQGMALPWGHLFTDRTTSLTQLGTNEQLTAECVQLLLEYAPCLAHLRCSLPAELHRGAEECPVWQQVSEAMWAVKELTSNGAPFAAEHLARLPASPDGLILLPHDGRVFKLSFELSGEQVSVHWRALCIAL